MLALVAVVLYLVLRDQPQNETKQAEAPAVADETELVILSVNDIHADIDMFAKFATMVDSLRAIYPGMLLFSAGDNRTGNPVNDQYDPVNYPMIELMNQTGFDLCAIGNHEWDANIMNLRNDIERAQFPFCLRQCLCSPVVESQHRTFCCKGASRCEVSCHRID